MGKTTKHFVFSENKFFQDKFLYISLTDLHEFYLGGSQPQYNDSISDIKIIDTSMTNFELLQNINGEIFMLHVNSYLNIKRTGKVPKSLTFSGNCNKFICFAEKIDFHL